MKKRLLIKLKPMSGNIIVLSHIMEKHLRKIVYLNDLIERPYNIESRGTPNRLQFNLR